MIRSLLKKVLQKRPVNCKFYNYSLIPGQELDLTALGAKFEH